MGEERGRTGADEAAGKAKGQGEGGEGRFWRLSMQAVPGCRIRVWKKEWQQTVCSQTSFLTGTRRTANRSDRRGQGRTGEVNRGTWEGKRQNMKERGTQKEGKGRGKGEVAEG